MHPNHSLRAWTDDDGRAASVSRDLRARGFSLLEVTVALAMATIILTVVVGMFVSTVKEGKRSRVLSELARDATFASQLMSQEIRMAGVGVPSGLEIIATGAGTARFASSVIAPTTSPLPATSQHIGILGDFPRPDAQYNAFGFLHTRATGPNRLAWHNENNGACVNPGACVGGMGAHSLFFDGTTNDCTAGLPNRTCAWGMGRVVQNEWLQVIAGDGTWANVMVSSMSADTAAIGGIVALPLSPGMPAPWTNGAVNEPPISVLGQERVASLDRIFYRYDQPNRRIVRRQCWGPGDPTDANWGGGTMNATSVGSPAALTPVAATCTDEEVIARWVDDLTFTFFNAANPPATPANLSQISRVDYRIVFRYPGGVYGRAVTYSVTGSIDLRQL